MFFNEWLDIVMYKKKPAQIVAEKPTIGNALVSLLIAAIVVGIVQLILTTVGTAVAAPGGAVFGMALGIANLIGGIIVTIIGAFIGAILLHVFALIVGEAAFVTLTGILTGIGLLYALLVFGQPLIASRFGLLVGMIGITGYEVLLMGIVCVAGVIIGIIPGYRVYKFSLADGMTVRV